MATFRERIVEPARSPDLHSGEISDFLNRCVAWATETEPRVFFMHVTMNRETTAEVLDVTFHFQQITPFITDDELRQFRETFITWVCQQPIERVILRPSVIWAPVGYADVPAPEEVNPGSHVHDMQAIRRVVGDCLRVVLPQWPVTATVNTVSLCHNTLSIQITARVIGDRGFETQLGFYSRINHNLREGLPEYIVNVDIDWVDTLGDPT